jgi:hypothetical protein
MLYRFFSTLVKGSLFQIYKTLMEAFFVHSVLDRLSYTAMKIMMQRANL